VGRRTRDTDYTKTTGDLARERRHDLLRGVQIRRRNPEVQREGNDITQAVFQLPYAHRASGCISGADR
jgi:hypothetical protein